MQGRRPGPGERLGARIADPGGGGAWRAGIGTQGAHAVPPGPPRSQPGARDAAIATARGPRCERHSPFRRPPASVPPNPSQSPLVVLYGVVLAGPVALSRRGDVVLPARGAAGGVIAEHGDPLAEAYLRSEERRV